eukprot:107632_1
MADEASHITENKIWNAYIDKHGKEPVTMAQLHNFAKGPNNPYDTISFKAVSQLYPRNQGKGKVSINASIKTDKQPSNAEDIQQLKKENEALRKQLNELLAQVESKTDDVDIKQEPPTKPKNALEFKTEYQLWNAIDQHIRAGDEDFIRQLLNQGLVTVNSVPKRGNRRSMLHIASNNGCYRIAQMLLNLGADVNYKSRFPSRDALQCAQSNGHYHVEKLLMLSKMDASASDQVNGIANKLNTQKGIIHYLYQAAHARQDEEVIFDGIVDIMIDVINKRQAFSDDILNLALDYSIKKALKSLNGTGEGDANNEEIDRDTVIATDLWQCIYNTCIEIITNKKHKKLEWFWLKTYLLSSTIWLRQFKDKRNNNELNSLYFELLDIVGAQALAQIDVYLKQPFQQVADDNISDWNALCAFDVEIEHKGDARQDAIEHGHKSQYTRDILGKKCVSIDPFNAFNHYDTRQYLSALVLTAQMVNSEFQKDIAKIFEINMKTSVGKFNAVYKEGPVKLLSRCQAKAEVDYKNEKFPTSAHVLDINRCSLIFDDISSMLKGLKLFDDAVRNHKENDICITQIIRNKNGWKEYSHANPTYADIKFNVVIQGEYHSIIGEVQFLLRSMMFFKNVQHPLYTIQRKKEFITSMGDILPFLTDIKKTLNVNASLGNVNGLCDAMVTQHLDVEEIVSNFDTLCLSGHLRALKCLIDIMPGDLLLYRCIGNKDRFGRPFLDEVVKTGQRQVLHLLFKQKQIREGIEDEMWGVLLTSMIRYCDSETTQIILTIGNVYQRIPKKAWGEAIRLSLHWGKKDYFVLFTALCDLNMVKELIISENYLTTAVRTNKLNSDGYLNMKVSTIVRLEFTKCIIDFVDFKSLVEDQHIADALYASVERNDIDVFKLICDELIKPKKQKIERYLLMSNTDDKQTTLQCACKEGNGAGFIDHLLGNVSDINMAKYVNYKGGECTAIAFAANSGESRIVDKLLQIPGIDVFGQNEAKSSCSVVEALKRGHLAIAEKLYSKLSDAQKQYRYDSKLLWDTVVSTIKRSDTASLRFVISKLVKNATDVLLQCDEKNGSLLTIATGAFITEMTEKVKYLGSVIPTDALKDLINYQTANGWGNAVFNAISHQCPVTKGFVSNIDVLKYFTTIPGIDFGLMDPNKKTAFMKAAGSDCESEIVELLFNQHGNEKEKLRALRREACSGFVDIHDSGKRKAGLTDIVLRNLDFSTMDVDVLNDESEFGENAMSWCARIGVMEFVDKLLQIEGVVVSSDAILRALTVDLYSTGELPIAQKLYAHLCDTGQQAFDFKKEELFDIFRGLSQERVGHRKSIPIMKFIVGTLINNAKEVSDLLIMKGDWSNIYDENVLITAMRHKQTEVCKYIMSLIAKDIVLDEINYQNEDGYSVLEYAAKHGCLDLFAHMVEKYNDVNMVQANSQTGDTPFHVAARYGYCDICKLVLEHCADDEQRLSVISLRNKKNETAVMMAKNKSVQIEIQKWKTEFDQ